MRNTTHELVGAASAVALARALELDALGTAAAVAAAVIGSRLPDVDQPGSRVQRRGRLERRHPPLALAGLLLRLPLFAFALLARHRGLSHSLCALVLVAGLSAGLGDALGGPAPAAAAGLALGYAGHVLAEDRMAGAAGGPDPHRQPARRRAGAAGRHGDADPVGGLTAQSAWAARRSARARPSCAATWALRPGRRGLGDLVARLLTRLVCLGRSDPLGALALVTGGAGDAARDQHRRRQQRDGAEQGARGDPQAFGQQPRHADACRGGSGSTRTRTHQPMPATHCWRCGLASKMGPRVMWRQCGLGDARPRPG
jgi:LexA-binding, inner membrane-associated putative hydrolase